LNFILDTDHLTILQQKLRPAFDRLTKRMKLVGEDQFCTTIISFHEQMPGWLAYLNRARSSAQIILAYGELEQMRQSFSEMTVQSYTDEAEDHFVSLRKQKNRIATMDLRIASIAISTGSTLLSRNLRDFRLVPGLTVED
jgi:tRNA(fMet)-specific endonuclease VapC